MSKLPFLMGMLAGLSADMPHGMFPKVHKCKDPLDGIDLEAEAELIRQKKSKLTASQRRRVMYLVEGRQR